MKIVKHYIAIFEFLLVFPGALFMTALFVRELQPQQYEPARTASHLVDWFSARPFLGLDIFLIALPFLAFVFGCLIAIRNWRSDAALRQAAAETFGALRAHLETALVAVITCIAGCILAIVALHMITD